MAERLSYDVLVIGSGLAGISCALRAASLGASVCMVTDGFCCEGSSFSTSTWGLGMVCESDAVDPRGPESLSKALCDVGMGMNDPKLAETLIARAPEALAFLTTAGARIIDPQNPGQREFVACFDHTVRTWHGFVGSASRTGLRRALDSAGVTIIERAVPISLLRDYRGSVAGALVLEADRPLSTLHKSLHMQEIAAQSTVMATGGVAGLYGHHLCSSRCRGLGHALALDAGASLVNMEFQQLMLGSVSPIPGIIFNEKLYRWTSFSTLDGLDAFQEHGIAEDTAREVLEAHSWHGPYTTRLASHLVDETLDAPVSCSPYVAHYDERIFADDAPEFIQTYLTWLRDERGVDPRAPMTVGMYAHSSNGGIVIDEHAHTDVEGLFACGECAGGVHGADRIGGLASVTAATFGLVAGEAAAKRSDIRPIDYTDNLTPCSPLLRSLECPDVSDVIGRALDSSCMVNRDERSLQHGYDDLTELAEHLRSSANLLTVPQLFTSTDGQLQALFDTHHALGQLQAARALLVACLGRRETRGPHHRSDYPCEDPTQNAPRRVSSTDLCE